MKILVLKRDKLGDLLLTTPMFRALRARFPDATIDLLASDYNAWVAFGHPSLSHVYTYPRVRIGKRFVPSAALAQLRLFAQLRRAAYDVIIVGQGEDSPRAVERALWARARRVISYVEPGHDYGPRLTDPLPLPTADHEAQRLLDLLVPLGIEVTLDEGAPYFQVPAQARDFAIAWLEENKLGVGEYVVLGLGARRARKQPSTAQILRWVRHIKDNLGLSTVFMWTPGDSKNELYPGDDEVAEPVLARAPRGLIPFRGALLPALGIIDRASASIFPDSGLMHFASASPGGVLGLFGDEPDFALKWRPLGSRSDFLVAKTVSEMEDATVYAAFERLLAANNRKS